MVTLTPPIVDPSGAAALFRAAIRRTDIALAKHPGNPRALELRGTIRFRAWLAGLAADTAAVHRAEADLRRAVDAAPDRSSAWRTLSGIYFVRGDFADSYWAATQAYHADIFLEHPEEILDRLFEAALDLDQDEAAEHWCQELEERRPHAATSAACLLQLLAWSADTAHMQDLWPIIRRASARAAGDVRTSARLRMRAAAVLARGGLRDSAKAVVERVQRQDVHDPELWQIEAGVRILLGQPDSALALLSTYVREDASSDQGILLGRRFRSLHEDPRFREIAARRAHAPVPGFPSTP